MNEALPKTEDWSKKSFFDTPYHVSNQHFAPLLEINRDLMLRGGKRWRPLLLILSAELENASTKKAYQLIPLIEFIHTASLIHDDIEDNSQMRRGDLSVHLKYGVDSALNAGAWLYFHALSIINRYDGTELEKAQIYRFAISTISALHLGQAMDIKWHREPDYIPSACEYEAMISLKTGALSELAGKLGVFCETQDYKKAIQLGKILQNLGIAFQVLDDITNITDGNKGKNRGDDIVEGKKSLPVILHLEENPSDILRITKYFADAKMAGVDSDAVKDCITLLQSGVGIEKARDYAKKRLSFVSTGIQDMYGNSAAVKTLIEFIEYLNKV